MFEDALGKPLTVSEVPEHALEQAWTTAPDEMNKAFSALMLGVARGTGIMSPPPTDRFALDHMTTVREFCRAVANSSVA